MRFMSMRAYKFPNFRIYMRAYRHETYKHIGEKCVRGTPRTRTPPYCSKSKIGTKGTTARTTSPTYFFHMLLSKVETLTDTLIDCGYIRKGEDPMEGR